jgi:hypothetical protein
MKCEICKKSINETFLNKIVGSYVKDEKGKKHMVCNMCQKEYKNKKEMLKRI